jgi:uncharacterized protein involved in exopolysaccharide biosynthesis
MSEIGSRHHGPMRACGKRSVHGLTRDETVDVEPLTLTELIVRMTSRWRVLAAGSLLGALAGLTVHLALPERYEATAVVFVDAPDPSRVDMTAEAAVASSRQVSTEALDALGDRRLTIEALEQAASASAVTESRLLRLTYSAPEPRAAARGADAVAQAYLAVRSLEPIGSHDAGVEGRVVDPARTPTTPSGPGLLPTTIASTTLGLLAGAPVAARPTRGRAARAS